MSLFVDIMQGHVTNTGMTTFFFSIALQISTWVCELWTFRMETTKRLIIFKTYKLYTLNFNNVLCARFRGTNVYLVAYTDTSKHTHTYNYSRKCSFSLEFLCTIHIIFHQLDAVNKFYFSKIFESKFSDAFGYGKSSEVICTTDKSVAQPKQNNRQSIFQMVCVSAVFAKYTHTLDRKWTSKAFELRVTFYTKASKASLPSTFLPLHCMSFVTRISSSFTILSICKDMGIHVYEQ